VVVEQAAHMANVEQPDAVTRAVLEHLNPAESERGGR
jgi:pimeloyl-ACP methyl ester carboxylesterase